MPWSANCISSQVADDCFRSLERLDPGLLLALRSAVESTVETSEAREMKEVKGLSERLQGMENLIRDVKRLLREQSDLGQAFLQNQQRASKVRDASILPDLCASHREQLQVMSENNLAILSVRRRIAKSKGELSANIHARMRWVVYAQDRMAENGRTIVMYAEELRRLNKKLEVIEQIHSAPALYIAAAVEVVRRRAFSMHYLEKANALSHRFSSLHDEELAVRKNFQSKIKGHFLEILGMFPGMGDVPPAFATACPAPFDARLPRITIEDVELLRSRFPDLAASLQLPDGEAISKVLAKSINQKLTAEDDETLHFLHRIPSKINAAAENLGTASVMNKLVSDCGNNNGGSSGNRRKKWMTRSNNSQFFFDSETDTDDGGGGGGGSCSGRKHSGERAKRRMSQSLTHSVSVTDDTEKSSADVNTTAKNGSNNGAKLTVPNSTEVILIQETWNSFLILLYRVIHPGLG